MSLKADYYTLCYARVLANPTPALTVAQWEEVLARTDAQRSRWRGLPTGMTAAVFGLYAALTLMYLGSDVLSAVFPDNEFGFFAGLATFFLLLFLLSSIFHRTLCLIPWRLIIHRRQIRRAGAGLGYVRVCIFCGYDLRRRSAEEVTARCPECGTMEEIGPPMMLLQPAMRPVFVYLFAWSVLGWLAFVGAVLAIEVFHIF